MSGLLAPENSFIFRIVHRDNVPWLLDNGIHCANSLVLAPTYVAIGNQDLIDKRKERRIRTPPGGYLSDYVPFYFTPHSPMLLNIKTGRNNVKKRSNEEIVVIVSSLRSLAGKKIPFLFTDRHAYLEAARFSADLEKLSRIDWEILKARDFKRDPDDPGKFERYQAEALIHQHMPVSAILGLACYTDELTTHVRKMATRRELALKVVTRPGWYFP